jgi:AraC-like DNA-binding protein
MSKFTILQPDVWQIPLGQRPSAALIAMGIHGPAAAEKHFVEDYWCVHFYTYSGVVVINDRPFDIRPGFVGVLPPAVRTVYSFPQKSVHACSHFELINSVDGDEVDISVMQDLGPRFGAVYQGMEEAIALFPSNRLQAEVRLWDILWQLAHPARTNSLTTNKMHPAVLKATEIIELQLRDSLPVTRLAEAVDLSQNHLTRLFRVELGETVIGYIQKRRVELATHLLRNTQLPIKTIAAQVGVSDPRLFNKLIHKSLGASPQEVRRR